MPRGMHASPSLATLLPLLAAGPPALAQGTPVPLPPHASLEFGISHGYGFTAQAPFTITALELPPEVLGGNITTGFMVRINGDTVFRRIEGAQSLITVRLPIRTGDVVDIFGNASHTYAIAESAVNSLTQSGPKPSTIQGVPHTLLPRRWTWDIGDRRWQSGAYLAPATGPLGRIFIYTMPESTALEGCCFPNGTCQMLTLGDCFDQGGVNRGPASGCTLPCPQPGACCTFDGQCRMMFDVECAANGRLFRGAGISCGGCTVLPALATNCNLPTGSLSLSGAPADEGDLWSEVARDEFDPTRANTTSGFLASGNRRLADDVVIPPGGMRLGFIKVPVHTTNATAITARTATLRIWNGSPADPRSQLIFGDATTNRLAHAEFSDIYRIFSSVSPALCGQIPPKPNKHRRIQWVYIAAPVHLPAGTYWLDWSASGEPGISLWGTPTTHPTAIGRQCDPGNANAISIALGAWQPAIDAGQGCNPTPVRQDLYFELLGAPGPLCYANCDGSTTAPTLTLDDFTCFINHFAAAVTLSISQQIASYANCDGSVVMPVLNIDDFTCFINAYAQGCN